MKPQERLVRLLPLPAKQAVKAVRHGIDPALVAAYRRRSGDRRPLPPSRMRARAGSPGPAQFLEGGRGTADEIERVLDAAGRPFAGFERVLDWGCGAGRVISQLLDRAGPSARLYGCDVDAEAVAWALQHYPRARFAVSQARPPLPFDADSFDLVYSISILTHLNEEQQLEWLRELGRVLRPGGLALLSVHGEHAFEQFRTGRVVSNTRQCAERMAVHGSLDDEGFVHEPYVRTSLNERDFPGADPTFGLAFHSREYIDRTWSETFEVVDVFPRAIAGFQDVVVARRP
jgi:SAM-dependent methyltransferase